MKKLSILAMVAMVFSACSGEESDNRAVMPDGMEVPEAVEVTVVEEIATSIIEVDDFEVEVSSVLTDDTGIGFEYDAEMLTDKDFSTAWCSDDDEGEVIFTFDQLVEAEVVGIVPGFGRDEAIYNQNNRIKKMRVRFFADNQASKEFELEDEYEMHFVDLGGKVFDKITFEILEVHEGAKFDDTCISEIDFWSDYVVSEDSDAAMDYYQENEAASALRPNDIVTDVIVTDYVYKQWPPDGPGFSDDSPPVCEGSIYAPGEDVNSHDWDFLYAVLDLHAFFEINDYGRLGDDLYVQWFYRDTEVVGFTDEGMELKKGGWVLMHS